MKNDWSATAITHWIRANRFRNIVFYQQWEFLYTDDSFHGKATAIDHIRGDWSGCCSSSTTSPYLRFVCHYIPKHTNHPRWHPYLLPKHNPNQSQPNRSPS